MKADRWQQIRERIEPHADILSHQGCLVQKKIGNTSFWFLRFTGAGNEPAVCRSLYICRAGDQELLERTRELLRQYRAPRGWVKEVKVFARLARSVWESLPAPLKKRGSRHRRCVGRPNGGTDDSI